MQTCDPGKSVSEVWTFLVMPGDTEWQKLGAEVNLAEKFNELGHEGGELVGPPADTNSVYSYKAANGTFHDRAYFLERRFYFKRRMD